VLPAVAGLPAAIPILTNAITGLTGAYPGALVTINGANLTAGSSGPAVTIGGQPASVVFFSASQITLQIPTSLSPGPALLTLNNGTASAYPVVVNIDTVPASITAIQNAAGNYIQASSPAHPGDLLIVSLTNFAPAGATVTPSQVQIGVAGVLRTPLAVNMPLPGLYQITFLMNSNEQIGSADQLIVYLNGRSSYPATLPVANTNGTFNISSPGGGN
jgi:uncharacterized protein (TIGR03437 family)